MTALTESLQDIAEWLDKKVSGIDAKIVREGIDEIERLEARCEKLRKRKNTKDEGMLSIHDIRLMKKAIVAALTLDGAKRNT